jgi:hypothetical protein
MIQLRKGDILYHGTSVEERFEDEQGTPDGPAWFSDSVEVAEHFKSWWEHPHPRVLAYRVIEEPKLVVWWSIQDIEDWFEQERGIESPESPHDMADELCAAGYDGWIIPENYPEGADILLCFPERHLVLVEGEQEQTMPNPKCPIRSEMYGGMPTGGGYVANTEYEIGAQRIAEAAHCLLGSLGNVGKGDDWDVMLRYERAHIEEELGIIVDDVKEYARDVYTRQFYDVSDYKPQYRERVAESARNSVASILKTSPKLRARAEERLAVVARDKTIPTEIRLVAVATYMVLIELANAMEHSVSGQFRLLKRPGRKRPRSWRWPQPISNAFRDPQLRQAVRTLQERVENLYL